MIYCFDIDGTICTNTDGSYENAVPFSERISCVNNLYSSGNYIKLFTARGSGTGINWRETTEKQLRDWGVNYHELILGKPESAIFVDDKAVSPDIFFSGNSTITEHIMSITRTFTPDFLLKLNQLSELLIKSFSSGGRLILAGNGGSFSDCMHFAAELTGRYVAEREPLPAFVLGSNPSSLTAISNDYSYKDVFSREFRALGTNNDILVCFSTSGTSENILSLLKESCQKDIHSVLFTSDRCTSSIASTMFRVHSTTTSTIQELHIMCVHLICQALDEFYG